jgi:hypothetical protein
MSREQRAMSKKRLTFEDGSVYEGNVVDGGFHGKDAQELHGVKPCPLLNAARQEPQKRPLLREGKLALASVGAKMTYTDGRVYLGDYADGKRNGKGKMVYPDGRVEEGNWKDGEFIE